MPINVSVLTISWKPGYIDSMVDALVRQTLPKNQWEWVFVDDLYDVRRDAVARHINGAFIFKHLPPREIKPYSATAIAINTGLEHCQGELVYFMADYMYPHPNCLARHWNIYKKHGPKLFISGPIVDNLTLHNKSVWNGAKPEDVQVKVGEKLLSFPDFLPPVHWPYKEPVGIPTPDNLISIWQKPFIPTWPLHLIFDWRLPLIANRPLDVGLCYCVPYIHIDTKDGGIDTGPQWWWCGRNDSAPLAILKEAGGMPDGGDRIHAGMDTVLAEKMLNLGCVYLADQMAPAIILPHPVRKPEIGAYPSAIEATL